MKLISTRWGVMTVSNVMWTPQLEFWRPMHTREPYVPHTNNSSTCQDLVCTGKHGAHYHPKRRRFGISFLKRIRPLSLVPPNHPTVVIDQLRNHHPAGCIFTSMTTLMMDMRNSLMLKRISRNMILGPLARYMNTSNSSRTKAPKGKATEDDTCPLMMCGVSLASHHATRQEANHLLGKLKWQRLPTVCPKPRARTPNPWLIGELMEELQEMTALFWTQECQLGLLMWKVLTIIA
jgi:hypothetical protein